MQNFHISGPVTGGTLRSKSVGVDTAVASVVATAKVTTSTGINNPGYLLTGGTLGPASFFDRTKTETVAGTGTGALDTAVQSLHALGDAHGVTGILLSSDPSLVGGVMLAAKPGLFLTNSAETKAIGSTALRAIDDAARAVLTLGTT